MCSSACVLGQTQVFLWTIVQKIFSDSRRLEKVKRLAQRVCRAQKQVVLIDHIWSPRCITGVLWLQSACALVMCKRWRRTMHMRGVCYHGEVTGAWRRRCDERRRARELVAARLGRAMYSTCNQDVGKERPRSRRRRRVTLPGRSGDIARKV